ncbi:AfsR/SARP family transcriptional regulator [Jiangella endophytica]|uniref:AfsR/SARP family transcriptional regulator n=1 Tax=Jiangella endophytica TaxID=1623398 RepID=UPI00130063B8|nr:BTAD domain-containing putative transcriptional regulator [Jiangella endophytica]
MELRLLGPMEVHADGRHVDIGTAKQRLVLAALALPPRTPVPVEVVIDRVWGERPPARARETVYSYIARLRQAGGCSAPIARRPGGYTLEVGSDAVDALVFRELVAAGRAAAEADPRGGARVLRRALALWRGRPLADVESEWADRVRAGLDQVHLEALCALGDAGVALGGPADVADELFGGVELYPLSEPLIGRLMWALSLADRRAEALEVYARTRERFADVLGEEPGPALSRLHQRVLTRDAPPETPGPDGRGPGRLPSPAPVFVGRAREREVVVDGLSNGPADGPPTVAICGLGGVGASTLAVWAAHAVAPEFPDGRLYADLRAGPAPAAVLGRFLHDLRATPGGPPSDVDEAAALFRTVTAGKRVLVLLDNAADSAQVASLVPAHPGCAALITSRTVLGALDDAVHVDLGPLSPDESAALLRRLDSTGRCAADAASTARLATLCGRLPLALSIVGERLAAHPSRPLTTFVERLADGRRRLDELATAQRSVRACFEPAYRALADGDELDRRAARAFRLLALPDGPDVSAATAQRLFGTARPETEALLARLIEVHLVRSRAPDRYGMHDLVRDYAREVAERDGR